MVCDFFDVLDAYLNGDPDAQRNVRVVGGPYDGATWYEPRGGQFTCDNFMQAVPSWNNPNPPCVYRYDWTDTCWYYVPSLSADAEAMHRRLEMRCIRDLVEKFTPVGDADGLRDKERAAIADTYAEPDVPPMTTDCRVRFPAMFDKSEQAEEVNIPPIDQPAPIETYIRPDLYRHRPPGVSREAWELAGVLLTANGATGWGRPHRDESPAVAAVRALHRDVLELQRGLGLYRQARKNSTVGTWAQVHEWECTKGDLL